MAWHFDDLAAVNVVVPVLVLGVTADRVVREDDADAGQRLVALPIRADLPVRIHPVAVDPLAFVFIGDQTGLGRVTERRAERRQPDRRIRPIQLKEAERKRVAVGKSEEVSVKYGGG